MPRLEWGTWRDADKLKKFYAWQAKVGLGPKFGSRPIGWYQVHHSAVFGRLSQWQEKNCGGDGAAFEVEDGTIFGRCLSKGGRQSKHRLNTYMGVDSMFQSADSYVRGHAGADGQGWEG